NTISADLMLAPNCLVCGKGLTDPASMARFIGPECAGTSSLHVPRMCSLFDGAEQKHEPAPAARRNRTASDTDPDVALFEAINGIAVSIIKGAGEHVRRHGRETVMSALALAMAECVMDSEELEAVLGEVRTGFEMRHYHQGEDLSGNA